MSAVGGGGGGSKWKQFVINKRSPLGKGNAYTLFGIFFSLFGYSLPLAVSNSCTHAFSGFVDLHRFSIFFFFFTITFDLGHLPCFVFFSPQTPTQLLSTCRTTLVNAWTCTSRANGTFVFNLLSDDQVYQVFSMSTV